MNRMNLGLIYQVCAAPDCRRHGKDLLKCGACLLVHYCGPEHQRAHRSAHKTSCLLVKQTRAAAAEAEAELRARPGDDYAPADPFDEGSGAIGRFWTLLPTRPYMQALHDHITACLNLRTGEAVEAALPKALEMLRLCRGDNLGVRSQVPVLYLRLGRDQDAFDFLKWYAVKGTDDYDWYTMSQPFLDLKGEDALEDLSEDFRKVKDLSFLATMTLVKTRLMLDLVALSAHVDEMEKKKAEGGEEKTQGGEAGDERPKKLSYEEKMEWVREEALSDIVLARRDIVDRDDYAPLIQDVTGQVARMYQLTEHHNKHYWPALGHPEKYSHALPEAYTWGSKQETVLAFRQTWYAWAECNPALETVRQFAEWTSNAS
ncbi:hypothetical protein PG993_009500 [Apiospora rasikravindrae]|uniref:MYND-type domain-containing protein n=1 Tax=Apiospora rasikravindrae TaxID=990691 RepID=A0ABR1SLB2_9PEZI